MNELECIRAFVRVAEVESFTKAAEQLNLAKSAVTKRVNQLEEHLELQLFQRSTRRLTITGGGAAFYQSCLHVLSDLDQAKSDVSTMEWSLSGTFRVSCISSFTHSYLADDLCEFQHQHPEIQIELCQHDRYCDPVQEGFDLSIQPAGSHSETLEEVEILQIHRLLVGSKEYLKSRPMPKTPQELKKHPLAHNSHVHPDTSIRLKRDGKTISVPVNPSMLTNTISLLRAAVDGGKTLALMPAFYIEDEIISEQFESALVDYRIPVLSLCAYYRKSSFVPMKTKIFLNFLVNKYRKNPPWQKRILEQKPELSYALGID